VFRSSQGLAKGQGSFELLGMIVAVVKTKHRNKCCWLLYAVGVMWCGLQDPAKLKLSNADTLIMQQLYYSLLGITR
jgi:hypothetical protein